jgi:Glycosyltransferase family 87
VVKLQPIVTTNSAGKNHWQFARGEKLWLTAALIIVLAFSFVLERRTALRHQPMTDLSVFCIASGALWSGQNLYAIPDWHGWHYQYPPALAIAFLPLAEPVPLPASDLSPEKLRTFANTPYGYAVEGKNYYGLHTDNAHFFFVVAAWYLLSVLGILFSAHAIGCALENKNLRSPPPEIPAERKKWWTRRLLPLAVLAGSLGTDLSRGQADVVMLTAIAAGIYFLTAQKKFRAGLCLAVPATIKLFPPFLLAYPFWRRQWRAGFGVIAGLFILLLALPVAALGPQRTKELYQCWFEVLAKPALGQGTDTSRQAELTGMGSTDNQSLLAAIHNWTYHSQPRGHRPVEAAAWERHLVYTLGIIMIAAVLYVIGWRRNDSPHELCMVVGLLIGLALLINPVVHNFYYLLLLPLVAAMLDLSFYHEVKNWKIILPVFIFMLADWLARMPGIGPLLRDFGVTTASLVWLLAVAAFTVVSQRKMTDK